MWSAPQDLKWRPFRLELFEPAPKVEGKEGTIRKVAAAPFSSVTVMGRTAKERGAVDITEAKVVVCVGRGFANRKTSSWPAIWRMPLAARSAARPIAEELRWLPEDIYLGISGKKIKPDLYIGLGVSGQIQHVTGIRDSKVIFAINRDENAPIFRQPITASWATCTRLCRC